MIAVAMLTTACGRIGFDPGGTSADGPPVVDATAGGVDSAGLIAWWLLVADYDDPAGGIEVFATDPASGGLMPTGQGVVTTSASPTYVAISPDGKNVYVPHESPTGDVTGFAVDPRTGYLTELAGSPFAGAGTMNTIAVIDRTGAAVFVSGSAGIQCYRRQADGSIAKVGAPVAADSAFQMAIDPLGRYLYSATYLGASVYGFRVDVAACTLTSLGPPLMVGDGIHGIAIDPTGAYVILNATSTSVTSVLAIDGTTGELTPLAGYPGGGRWVSFAPAGDRVYVADNSSGLWAYAFDPATGAMTAAPGAPYALDPAAWYVLPDAAGTHVYASDRANLSGFTVGQTGALIPLTGLPAPAVSPMAMGLITTTY